MRYRILTLLVILSVAAGLAKAADAPVNIKSDNIWGDTKNNLSYLEGNVRIIQGSTVITTAQTKVDLDKKTAFFETKVKLSHTDVTIDADSLEYNFKKKSGTFSGNVVLNRAEVKDDQGKVSKDAFKLTAAELYFESDNKNFVAKRNGVVEHKEFSGTADTISYNDNKQELLFKGNADIKRPDGETITGKEIVINTKTNDIIVKNQVKLVHEDVTILGDHLEYNYKKKRGSFTENVILDQAETRNDKGKITKDQFKLTTNGLDFDSETKNFTTQSQGTVKHKNFDGSGDRIEYNDGLQELRFKNNAKLIRPKGEEISSDLITIYIKEKSFEVTSHVTVNFKVESDEK